MLDLQLTLNSGDLCANRILIIHNLLILPKLSFICLSHNLLTDSNTITLYSLNIGLSH